MASGEIGLLTRHPWVTRRALTVAEYHRMGEVGILHEGDRVELIEVADSSVAYDRAVKRAVYARHGIPEFWIVNLQANSVEVRRMPVGEAYTDLSLDERDGALEPVLLPGAAMQAAVVLT